MIAPVSDVRVRTILDSRAQPTFEADVRLASGASGRGSSPAAIAPGSREQPISHVPPLDAAPAARPWSMLCGQGFANQMTFDEELEELATRQGLGANLTLALSLAYCRASAADRGVPLHIHLAQMTCNATSMPHPLINVFSGGIHRAREARCFQQLMLVPLLGTLAEEVRAGLQLFAALEERVATHDDRWWSSASSGMVVDGASTERLLNDLRTAIDHSGLPAGAVGLGVDVAAEHLLAGPDSYRFEDRVLSGEQLLAFLEALAREFELVYLEDPFAPHHAHLWRELTARLDGTVSVVGDDLFATRAEYVDRDLATAILLKPSQAGTLTATLDAARTARTQGLELCVSHRSGETEDTSICDLAVALGARYVKVGGPRRGDRIAKYNQLLRLGEQEQERRNPGVVQAA